MTSELEMTLPRRPNPRMPRDHWAVQPGRLEGGLPYLKWFFENQRERHSTTRKQANFQLELPLQFGTCSHEQHTWLKVKTGA